MLVPTEALQLEILMLYIRDNEFAGFVFSQRILSRFGRKLHVMWVFTCVGVHESVYHIEKDSCKTVKANGETDLASQPPSE